MVHEDIRVLCHLWEPVCIHKSVNTHGIDEHPLHHLHWPAWTRVTRQQRLKRSLEHVHVNECSHSFMKQTSHAGADGIPPADVHCPPGRVGRARVAHVLCDHLSLGSQVPFCESAFHWASLPVAVVVIRHDLERVLDEGVPLGALRERVQELL